MREMRNRTAVIHFFRQYWILLFIIALKFVLQFVLVNPYYELHRDEFLHLDQAAHPAWGYISVPPLTSVISKLIFLLGGDEFWIRFFPALFGALTILFTWLIVETAGGGLISKVIASLAMLFSVFVRLNILFQPNAFDYLAWTVIFYLVINYIKTGNKKWLWFIAVAIAIGFYNKYSIVFLIFGLFCGLLLTTERRVFLRPFFWTACLLALILVAPNLIWQYKNHFPVIDHMRVLKENQLDNNSAAGFLASQVKIILGSLPLVITAIFALLFYKPFRLYRFIVWSFLVVMLLFTFLKAKDYYSLGLYPIMIAFGSVFVENALKYRIRSAVIFAIILFNLIVFASMIQYVMPVFNPIQITGKKAIFEKLGMLRWEDGKNHHLPQDFADMTGWKEMADKAYAAYRMIPVDERQSTLVFCDNYGETGALNYYNRGKMKEAFSFNTDYIYWLPKMSHIQNVILIGEKPDDEVIKLFREFELTGVVENEYSRERNTGIYILKGADPSFTDVFYRIAEERKLNLDIF